MTRRKKIKKRVITGWILTGLLLIQFTVDEGEFKNILSEKMESYKEKYPMEMLYVHTDRDVYSPGDELYFKAYVMDLYSSKPSQSSNTLTIVLMDYQGRIVLNSSFDIEGSQATGSLLFTNAIPEGKYTLIGFTDLMRIGKPEHAFKKSLFISNISFPHTIIHLSTPDTLYGPGDEAAVHIRLLSPNGKPDKNSFTYEIKVNENSFLTGEGKTDKTGKSVINIKLPDFQGYSLISAVISVERSRTVEKNCIVIPVAGLAHSIRFFPEGGKLIDGVETKVGFIAHDYFGNLPEIEGQILGQDNNVLTSFRSLSDGVGYFTIVPEKNRPAKVKITKPAGIDDLFDLPEISSRGVMISFIDRLDDRLAFEIINTLENKVGSFHIVAEQNGEIVWYQRYPADNKVNLTIPVTDLSGGLVHVTLFNSEGLILGHRAVYLSKKSSTIQIITSQNEYVPGEEVKLDLKVSNMEGAGEVADLSVSVADANINPNWNKDPDIFSYFLLGPGIRKSPFPPGYFSEPTAETERQIDALMLTMQDEKFNWFAILDEKENTQNRRASDNFLEQIQNLNRLDYFRTLHARIENAQFFYRYILKYNLIFPEYYLVNRRYLFDKESIDNELNKRNWIQNELSSGTPILDVIRRIKNYQLVNNKMVFYGPNSINFQEGALIVFNGIRMGTDVDILSTLSPHDIKNIRVITNTSEVLMYTGLNPVGIVEITTKGGEIHEDETGDESQKYNPTLYWNPFVFNLEDKKTSISFTSTEVKSSYKIVVQGIDEKGNPLYETKNFSVY